MLAPRARSGQEPTIGSGAVFGGANNARRRPASTWRTVQTPVKVSCITRVRGLCEGSLGVPARPPCEGGGDTERMSRVCGDQSPTPTKSFTLRSSRCRCGGQSPTTPTRTQGQGATSPHSEPGVAGVHAGWDGSHCRDTFRMHCTARHAVHYTRQPPLVLCRDCARQHKWSLEVDDKGGQ